METAIAFLGIFLPTMSGGLSFYAPNDGHNAGNLSCGGRFTAEQDHIAIRSWRKLGCGRRVVVCAEATGQCRVTKVRDAGPFGITDGRRRRVHTRGRLPTGWRYRGVADLSVRLWRKLGKPAFLSRLHVIVLPTDEDYDDALAAVRALLPLQRRPVL